MKNILITIFTFLVLLILSDLFFRLTGISEVSNNEIYEDIGRGRRKDLHYIKFNEGFSMGKFNSYRYLGPGYSKEKSRRTFRIALIGDSFVEGFQVFDRNHFRSILEDSLKIINNELAIEVLNFGRSGFDIGDMFCYYKLFVEDFKPDLYIYLVSENDFQVHNSDPLRPRLYYNDSLIVDNSLKDNVLVEYPLFEKAMQNSTVVNMSNNARKVLVDGGYKRILFDKFSKSTRSINIESEEDSFEVSNAVKIVINQISKTNVLIVNRGVLPLNQQISNQIKQDSINYLDLSGKFEPTEENDPFYWEVTNKRGHLNNEGHIILANALFEYIVDIGLIESKSSSE